MWWNSKAFRVFAFFLGAASFAAAAAEITFLITAPYEPLPTLDEFALLSVAELVILGAFALFMILIALLLVAGHIAFAAAMMGWHWRKRVYRKWLGRICRLGCYPLTVVVGLVFAWAYLTIPYAPERWEYRPLGHFVQSALLLAWLLSSCMGLYLASRYWLDRDARPDDPKEPMRKVRDLIFE